MASTRVRDIATYAGGRATSGVHKESDPWTSEIVRIQKLDVEINVNPGLLIPLPAPLGCWLSWSALSYVQPQTSSWSQRVIEEAEQSESYHPSNDVAKPTVNHLQEQSPIVRCFVDIGFATSVFKDGSRNRRWSHDDYFKKRKQDNHTPRQMIMGNWI